MTTKVSLGTVSHGTLRNEDLVEETNMYTQDGMKQLYQAALDADAAYQAALIEEYGDKASEMRYAQVLPSRLALLRGAKLEADEAWLKAMPIV